MKATTQTIGRWRVSMVRDGDETIAYGGECNWPEDAFRLFCGFIPEDDHREHFAVAMLNTRGKVLSVSIVSIGTLDCTLATPREVFRPAVLCAASSIVVCHNHPSGDNAASAEDIRTTERLQKAGEVLGIALVDHIIIGENASGERTFTSLKRQGLI